ncbi:hypothetical protein FE697_010290 [Mumia zhuanghuii]|uniref:Mce-associated membrane protein n=2 Tax=Mumia TaxID=1546255 RepID=A0ABW1QRV0_9ACTN|nr:MULTISPECIES: hypothetical protein [Mumia]KAA1423930.1 hypothetical protein FE697_010290 [Mumia zhuanghuii]
MKQTLDAVRPHLVLILSALMLAIGIVGLWTAYDLRSADAAQNLAVVDEDATAAVQSEVSRALVSVLSYDYSDPTPTEQAADEVLAGDAREEYDKLFASLQERAPGQQLVLTAQVQVAAVKTLTDDSAELLVFLDQSSQRASDQEASVSAAQLAVDAEKVGGVWKVTGLTPL